MRLDKFLADCGLGSRSEVKKLISQKRITVDGVRASTPKQGVSEASEVCFDGEALVYQAFHYLMLNKPAGVLSATKDGATETVIDLLDEFNQQFDYFPVGRLDKDTTGFILLTDDGKLAHQLLHPKHHVKKRYVATVSPILGDAAIEAFADGITLEDGHQCLPATLHFLEETSEAQRVEIIIEEGKFHQIKRMVASCGSKVLTLHRTDIGNVRLDTTLELGEYRSLRDDEITSLRAHTKE